MAIRPRSWRIQIAVLAFFVVLRAAEAGCPEGSVYDIDVNGKVVGCIPGKGDDQSKKGDGGSSKDIPTKGGDDSGAPKDAAYPKGEPGATPGYSEPPPPSVQYGPDGVPFFFDGTGMSGLTVADLEKKVQDGRAGEVEEFMNRILERDPEDATALAVRSWAKFNQPDKKDGALDDADAALKLDPKNKTAQEIKDYIELTGRAAATDVKLKAPRFESKDMGARFDGDGSEGGLAGAGRLGGGARRSPSQAGGGGDDGAPVDAVDSGGAGWTATGRDPAAAYAPGAQGTLPMSQGLSPSQVLVQETVRLMRLGDVSGALLSATRAIQTDRDNAYAWAVRAGVSNRLKNYDAAISDATEAIKLQPKNVTALLDRGYAQFSLSNYSAALEDIGSALKLEPMNALGYLYRGMVLEKLARYTEALSDYETAAKLDPSLRHFWEEAKERILGKKPGNEGRMGMTVKRVGFWAVPVGLAFLLIFIGLWRRKGEVREVAEAATFPEVGLTAPQAAGAMGPAPADGTERPPAQGGGRTTAPGSLLAGTYRVGRELGKGGMGVVYEALDEKLQRLVALKRLKREAYDSPELKERFLKEARLVAKLRHPNLAEIFAVVGEEDLYLVFELVQGEALDKTLSRRGRLSLDEAKKVVAEVCAALEYAHAEHVIHRDLKPSNVMFDKEGRAKVMDFGIAHEARSGADLTQTAAWGTPPYMAPEQEGGRVGRESDLYALAVMAYEMLAGSRPFAGPYFLEKKLKKQYPAATAVNGTLPKSADVFFSKALEPEPEKRFRTAAEFAGAFGALRG